VKSEARPTSYWTVVTCCARTIEKQRTEQETLGGQRAEDEVPASRRTQPGLGLGRTSEMGVQTNLGQQIRATNCSASRGCAMMKVRGLLWGACRSGGSPQAPGLYKATQPAHTADIHLEVHTSSRTHVRAPGTVSSSHTHRKRPTHNNTHIAGKRPVMQNSTRKVGTYERAGHPSHADGNVPES
jgi:hypothetical protein